MCFQDPLRSLKKCSYNFHKICQNTLWIPKSHSLRFLMLDITRKSRPKPLFHQKGCLFSKNLCFQQPLRSLKKWYYKVPSVCQNTMWTLMNCSLRFVMFYNTRNQANIFFHWIDCLFSKNCVFHNLLGVTEMIL